MSIEVEKMKEFIGAEVNPNAKIEISANEFLVLKQFFSPFQVGVSIFNNIEQRLFATGIIKPFTQDDLKEDGKLRDDFFPKEEN